jgi:hypothetical protein
MRRRRIRWRKWSVLPELVECYLVRTVPRMDRMIMEVRASKASLQWAMDTRGGGQGVREPRGARLHCGKR